ncbi:GNAT family N-acetyltransferase [Mesorhizobium sp. M0036]|uniref:GNAT family N-acetyltransferase n=1 Tax=Mesorhizobium sp. M0036 TaxID=2956853 RepID=UPI003334A8AC
MCEIAPLPLTDFHDRLAAVEFAQRILLPEKSVETRTATARRLAVLYCHEFVTDTRDACAPSSLMHDVDATIPIYVVRDDGDIVGAAVCSVLTSLLPLRLLWLAVDPAFRARGIGMTLARHVARSAPVVHLSTDKISLVSFYDTAGFRFWQEAGPPVAPWFIGSTTRENQTLAFGKPRLSELPALSAYGWRIGRDQ